MLFKQFEIRLQDPQRLLGICRVQTCRSYPRNSPLLFPDDPPSLLDVAPGFTERIVIG